MIAELTNLIEKSNTQQKKGNIEQNTKAPKVCSSCYDDACESSTVLLFSNARQMHRLRRTNNTISHILFNFLANLEKFKDPRPKQHEKFAVTSEVD